MEKLIEPVSELDDPRCAGKVEHRLIDILVIAVCAVLACAESWEDISLYGRSKQAWLGRFLTLPNGIPSHDTFRRVFMLIDADAFETCFTAWAQGIAPWEQHEVVAIDGQTVRRSFDRGREHAPLHLVSAWASGRGLVLGQRRVDGQSHESTAIPELLDTLALEHTLVTLDAMGCQKAIAERMLKRGADDLLVLKANHGHAHAAVQSHFDHHGFRRGAVFRPEVDVFEECHGRLVRRRVFVSPEAAMLPALADWPQWRTVLAIESLRSVNDGRGQVEADIRYFRSSSAAQAPVLAQAVRRHWSIANHLHWILDVNFREDDSRLRDPTAVRNFALWRKIALTLVSRHQSTKASLRAKRKRAAWDNDSRHRLLNG